MSILCLCAALAAVCGDLRDRAGRPHGGRHHQCERNHVRLLPGALALSIALHEPKHQETAACRHFSLDPYTKDDEGYFEGVNVKDLAKYASMIVSTWCVAAGLHSVQLVAEMMVADATSLC